MKILQASFISFYIALAASLACGENIDPAQNDMQYAYAENSGWFNAEPVKRADSGVQVEGTSLTGYLWAENIGWISLSCVNTDSC